MLATIQQSFYTYYGHSSKSQKVPGTGTEYDENGSGTRGRASSISNSNPGTGTGGIEGDDDFFEWEGTPVAGGNGNIRTVEYGSSTESRLENAWGKVGLLLAILAMGGVGFERWLRKGRHVKRP